MVSYAENSELLQYAYIYRDSGIYDAEKSLICLSCIDRSADTVDSTAAAEDTLSGVLELSRPIADCRTSSAYELQVEEKTRWWAGFILSARHWNSGDIESAKDYSKLILSPPSDIKNLPLTKSLLYAYKVCYISWYMSVGLFADTEGVKNEYLIYMICDTLYCNSYCHEAGSQFFVRSFHRGIKYLYGFFKQWFCYRV